ncbi:hypothetical protein [Rhizobium sp. P007]|uniref:hypothetical protein n=1 Tax=Rhizobium sp. P007 TaxID=285908 RepID=UPI00115A168E|nr:hypothetical protein [Rhizobium sp. P007]CAD7041302.1 hypothetical protein RP007_00733 [Rhizobium sp. P007]
MVIDIPLTSWTPDLPPTGNPGLTSVYNAIPTVGAGGVTYNPMPSSSLFSDSSLPEPPLGAATGTDYYGIARTVVGTRQHLFLYKTSSRQWDDRTRSSGPYQTAAGDRWRFIQYQSSVIGTNATDVPQWINTDDINASFGDLTTLVRGKYITQHKGFVILGNTTDALDGQVNTRIRWSAQDNPFDWSYSQATLSDFQDFPDLGQIQGLVSQEDVWIVCRNGIGRMHYIGAPWAFQFDTVVNGKGCAYPESLTSVEGKIYFLDDDGFYMFNGQGVTNIGLGKINDTFFEMFDSGAVSSMTATIDPRNTLIYWTFASKGARNGVADTTLMYNYVTGDWSIAEAISPYVFTALSLAWTIEELDVFGTIENVPAAFDAPIWAGGNEIIWGIDTTGKIYTPSGPPRVATFVTTEMQLSSMDEKAKSDTALITKVRPFMTGSGSAAVAVGTRQLPNSTVMFSQYTPTNNVDGYAYLRSLARFHRVRLQLSGQWQKASKIQLEFVFGGKR